MTCSCGNIYEKGRVRCDSCQAKIDTEKYYSLPMVEWDETDPVCDFHSDNYYFDVDSLLDAMNDELEEAKKQGNEPDMHIVLCEPKYLHLLDEDTWCDELPDEGELSEDVVEAINVFNAVLKAQGPSCWYPGKVRINMEPLWDLLKEDLANENSDEDKG